MATVKTEGVIGSNHSIPQCPQGLRLNPNLLQDVNPNLKKVITSTISFDATSHDEMPNVIPANNGAECRDTGDQERTNHSTDGRGPMNTRSSQSGGFWNRQDLLDGGYGDFGGGGGYRAFMSARQVVPVGGGDNRRIGCLSMGWGKLGLKDVGSRFWMLVIGQIISVVLLFVIDATVLYMSPFKRGFFCDDKTYEMKYDPHQTVSLVSLYLLDICIPLVIVVSLETSIYFCKRHTHIHVASDTHEETTATSQVAASGPSASGTTAIEVAAPPTPQTATVSTVTIPARTRAGHTCFDPASSTITDAAPFGVHPLLYNLYRYIGCCAFALASTCACTDVIKVVVGGLRPHFLTVCSPDWSKITCKKDNHSVYVTDYTCLGSNTNAIDEARRSFPSGHSSSIMAAMLFVVIYLQARLFWQPEWWRKRLLHQRAQIRCQQNEQQKKQQQCSDNKELRNMSSRGRPHLLPAQHEQQRNMQQQPNPGELLDSQSIDIESGDVVTSPQSSSTSSKMLRGEYWFSTIRSLCPFVQVLCLLLVAFVAASRYSDFFHHPRDIIAGLVLGALFTLHATFFVIDIRKP